MDWFICVVLGLIALFCIWICALSIGQNMIYMNCEEKQWVYLLKTTIIGGIIIGFTIVFVVATHHQFQVLMN